jgi:hypothetical protein
MVRVSVVQGGIVRGLGGLRDGVVLAEAERLG